MSAAQAPKAPLELKAAPWGKPLAGGTLRVLLVAPRHTLGDARELEDRFDLRLDTVPLWDSRHLGHDPLQPVEGAMSAEETTEALHAALQRRYDVIVLGNFDVSILPERMQTSLVNLVIMGTGLLVTHSQASAPGPLRDFLGTMEAGEAGETLRRGVGPTGGRGWLLGPGFIRHTERGEGRAMQLAYPGDPPLTHCLIAAPADPVEAPQSHLDNAFSMVGRALLWAARRDPPIRIVELVDTTPTGPAEEEIPPGFPEEFVQGMRDSVVAPPLRPFRLVLSEAADQRYDVRVQLRTEDEVVQIPETPREIARGTTLFGVDLPVRAGRYYVDIWLSTRRGVHTWHTAEIDVPGWPDFSGLRASKTHLLPHDTLDITVDIRAIFHPDRHGTLYARAVDPWGRSVAKGYQPIQAEGGPATIQLNFAHLLAPLVTVQVFALEGVQRQLLDWSLHSAAGETFLLPVRLPQGPGNLRVLSTAPAVEEFNSRQHLRALQEAGVDMLYARGGDAALVHAARSRLHLLPELSSYSVDTAVDGVIRRPCLTDPEFQRRQSVLLQDGASFHWAGGSAVYSLGAGNCLVRSEENVCQSPTCLAGFQTFLRGRYDSLDALNTAWQQQLPAWDAARPLDQFTARETGNYAPYVDFRLYMDTLFSGFHAHVRQHVVRVDAEARVGMRTLGHDNPMHGYALPLLTEALDFLAVPPEPVVVEKLRSYHRPGMFSALVASGQDASNGRPWTAGEARWLPWYGALQQLPGLWMDDAFGTALEAAPEASVLPDGSISAQAERLLAPARELKGGLAPLLLGATPVPAKVAILESASSRHLNDALAAPGMGSLASEKAFVMVLRMLGVPFEFVPATRTVLDRGEQYRVLMLPQVRSLSTHELAQIAAFAEAGGTILADILPGTHDQHGVPRAVSPLAELFDSTPGETEDATNNSRHVLLNAPVIGPDSPEAQRLAVALAAAECPPAFEVTGHRDAPFLGARFRYHYGSAEVFALLADPGAPEQRVRVAFPPESYIYDIRAGTPVTNPRRHQARLAPGEASVYAILPHAVDDMLLLAPEAAFVGRRLDLRAGLNMQGDTELDEHLIRFDIRPEGGAPMLHYRQFVRARNGIAEAHIPLAHNERLGRYVITAQDLLTGVRAEARLSINFLAD